jgi:hypothetical protein
MKKECEIACIFSVDEIFCGVFFCTAKNFAKEKTEKRDYCFCNFERIFKQTLWDVHTL